jgi:hypothetical protein
VTTSSLAAEAMSFLRRGSETYGQDPVFVVDPSSAGHHAGNIFHSRGRPTRTCIAVRRRGGGRRTILTAVDGKLGGSDGTLTRGILRDRQAF